MTTWAPPDPTTWEYTHNIIDHLLHDVTNEATVDEQNRITIEHTTERFLDEGDFTIYVIKNVSSQVQHSHLYCHTCELKLDVPNQLEWAT